MQNVNKVSRTCKDEYKPLNLLQNIYIGKQISQKHGVVLGHLLCTLFFALSLNLSSFQTRVKADCTVD